MLDVLCRLVAAALLIAVVATPAFADDRVTFPSLAANNGQGAAIVGYLARPKGQGPFPAVVVLHSCLGMRADRRGLADMLTGWGYVALFVDDFSSRRLQQTCAVDFPEGLGDAYGGLGYVDSLPYVDRHRIGVLGYSQGADTALQIATAGAAVPFALPAGAGFSAVAAFYPPCENQNQHRDRLALPTLIVVGADDTVTPAAACRKLVSDQRGADATLAVLPGAGHVFDDPAFADGRQFMGMWLEFNPAAAAKARPLLRRFLDARLSP